MADFAAPTPQLKVLKAALDAYLARDISSAEPLISKDFKFRTFPKDPDHPDDAKEDHIKKYGPMLASWTDTKFTTHEVIEAPGKVVLHASATFTTIDGSTVDYDTVTIVSFVEEDGNLKILEAKDFCDPHKRSVIHATAARVTGGLVV